MSDFDPLLIVDETQSVSFRVASLLEAYIWNENSVFDDSGFLFTHEPFFDRTIANIEKELNEYFDSYSISERQHMLNEIAFLQKAKADGVDAVVYWKLPNMERSQYSYNCDPLRPTGDQIFQKFLESRYPN